MFQTLSLLLCLASIAAAGTLQGKAVEDHSGSPLASVEIKIYKTGQQTLAAHLETDTSGRFRAGNLSEGDYRIEATKANFIGATLRVQNMPAELVIRLVRSGSISGRVLDGQSQPIPGAAVYAMPKPSSGPTRPFAAPGFGTYVSVDPRGTYRLYGLPPGEYAVAVAYGASTSMFGSSGQATVKADVGSGVQLYPTSQQPRFFTISGGEQYPNIDFTVVPSALQNVSGKLDLPAPGTKYWLALVLADQPGLAQAVAETRPDGSFQFEGVPAGPYILTASGPIAGYGGKAVLAPKPYFGRTQVSVTGNTDNITVPLQHGRSLSFLLKAQEAATGCPSTAQLRLIALEDFAARIDGGAALSREKPMSVDDLAPTRYQVDLSGLGESCSLAADTVLDLTGVLPEGPVALTVTASGAIHGKLTGTSDPATFAVALVAADPDRSSSPVQVVIPAADGRFAFANLRAGRYRIAAQPATATTGARWLADPAHTMEIWIPAGSPTDMELPAPKGRQP